MENKKGLCSKEDLFDMLVKLYWGQVKRESFPNENDKGNSQIRNLAITYINNNLKRLPNYPELLDLIDDFYNLLKNTKIEPSWSRNQFEIFCRKNIASMALKREKYDMSDFFKTDYIAQRHLSNSNTTYYSLKYQPKENPSVNKYNYPPIGEISLEHIGTLQFKEWNMISNFLPKYRITIINKNGESNTYEVFSNILISQMDNPEYQEAVFKELLCKKNLTLANSGGYIGSIVSTPEDLKNTRLGTEYISPNKYVYYYNLGKYSLQYDSLYVSAAKLYGQIIQNKPFPSSPGQPDPIR